MFKKEKKKGGIIIMNQDELRKYVKMAKACNEDITYKDFAEYLEININSFYNWINKSYDLSNKKAEKLLDFVSCLIC